MKSFKIPIRPSTTSKSIRFPRQMAEQVANAIFEKESSFSAFVVEATRLALERLEKEETEEA